MEQEIHITLRFDLATGKVGFNEIIVPVHRFGVQRSAPLNTEAVSLIEKETLALRRSHSRVKDKERIEDPKSLLKMIIFPSYCQFSSQF